MLSRLIAGVIWEKRIMGWDCNCMAKCGTISVPWRIEKRLTNKVITSDISGERGGDIVGGYSNETGGNKYPECMGYNKIKGQ